MPSFVYMTSCNIWRHAFDVILQNLQEFSKIWNKTLNKKKICCFQCKILIYFTREHENGIITRGYATRDNTISLLTRWNKFRSYTVNHKYPLYLYLFYTKCKLLSTKPCFRQNIEKRKYSEISILCNFLVWNILSSNLATKF